MRDGRRDTISRTRGGCGRAKSGTGPGSFILRVCSNSSSCSSGPSAPRCAAGPTWSLRTCSCASNPPFWPGPPDNGPGPAPLQVRAAQGDRGAGLRSVQGRPRLRRPQPTRWKRRPRPDRPAGHPRLRAASPRNPGCNSCHRARRVGRSSPVGRRWSPKRWGRSCWASGPRPPGISGNPVGWGSARPTPRTSSSRCWAYARRSNPSPPRTGRGSPSNTRSPATPPGGPIPERAGPRPSLRCSNGPLRPLAHSLRHAPQRSGSVTTRPPPRRNPATADRPLRDLWAAIERITYHDPENGSPVARLAPSRRARRPA